MSANVNASTSEVFLKAKAAKAASSELSKLPSVARANALFKMADALVSCQDELLVANESDVALAKAANTPLPLIDRLLLDAKRLAAIADSLREIARLEDPIGTLVQGRSLYNGIRMRQVRVPLGVVAMIYEARPNVTADAAGLCLKTANAVVLRGGSLANKSCVAMANVLYAASLEAGMPKDWLQIINTTSREATNELMQLHGIIDVLVPRGSASLIRSTVENARVPVIETGEGNCHIYIHKSADASIIVPIVINAKTQRPGVCNAIESLLVDKCAAANLMPPVLEALFAAGVKVHADEQIMAIAQGIKGDALPKLLEAATEDDWGREYLDMEISIKCVQDVNEAICHINRYSTHHSDSILASDYDIVSTFLQQVDSAAVYANASTRFTDGGEFGLGAELGISTQKLHARGPMGLTALTSTKFILEGNGQVRS
ncbi:MAG: glutamate-5-semialdehyde dehydrogenase [Coriobacteriales bacterium]|jgi:glutamate-5-semialdehyde dehydrogenase|nr:glutamate-5-semialdehyde dehydrogenase [Coriobacteriales bacterium]